MHALETRQAEFERDGFAILRHAVSLEQIANLSTFTEELRQEKNAAGMRNLLNRSAAIKDFAASGVVYECAKLLLGCAPLPVRGILFDKTPQTNWYVTWHQDLSIPVQEKLDLDGYGPWSVKDDIVHVQPPAEILEKMVSLRIHIDACAAENGAIKFIAGSHRSGILTPESIAGWRENHEHSICPAEIGDVIAMRPLVLHSSSISESPYRRRVLHLEYAGVTLAPGLKWAEA